MIDLTDSNTLTQSPKYMVHCRRLNLAFLCGNIMLLNEPAGGNGTAFMRIRLKRPRLVDAKIAWLAQDIIQPTTWLALANGSEAARALARI